MKKILACVLSMVMLLTCTVTAMAAPNDFVPSIEQKPGPGLVQQQTQDGRPGYGIIVMPDGKEIAVPESDIIITPIGDADKAEDDVREALENALESIKDADSLEEIIKNIQDLLDTLADGTDADDLVITDLFHVGVTNDYKELLDKGGKLQLKFDGLSGLIAAMKKDNGKWSSLLDGLFKDNGDGTYTLIIDSEGVFAFLRDAGKVDVDYSDPEQSSPQTGDMTVLMIVSALTLIACAAAMFAFVKKQQA